METDINFSSKIHILMPSYNNFFGCYLNAAETAILSEPNGQTKKSSTAVALVKQFKKIIY